MYDKEKYKIHKFENLEPENCIFGWKMTLKNDLLMKFNVSGTESWSRIFLSVWLVVVKSHSGPACWTDRRTNEPAASP